MEIYTSYYGNIRKLGNNSIIPVGISLGIPKWFNGHNLRYLAPTHAILRLQDNNKYTTAYLKHLESVNIDKLREDISMISRNENWKDVALLCYEKPGDFCHRRLFAKWLEEKTGYKVKEYGFNDEPVKKEEVSQGTLF